jgi:acetyltransferase-like isoleucine patch superfamily enzyme
MIIFELIKKIKFWRTTDRIGPDIPWTHWRLNFKSTMQSLCKQKFLHFGDGAELRLGAYVVGCSKISIGNRVIIRPNCMFFGDTDEDIIETIKIEDDVMMGAGVHIYVNNHKFERLDIPLIEQGYYDVKPVVLKKGCWLGANTIVLPGVTIGANSVIGAGSVVTKSIPDGVVAAGNPAKIIKYIGKHE